MFADDVIARGVPDYHPSRMAPILERIKRAQKFQLSPEFTAVADELRLDIDQIAKALPLCRLPYPITWVEFSEAHRNRHASYAEPLRWMQAPVKRVGFLFVADNERDLTKFKAHMFWEHAPHRVEIENYEVSTNPDEIKAAVHCARFDLTGESDYPIPSGGDPGVSWQAASEEGRQAFARTVGADIAEYSPPTAWLMLAGNNKAVHELAAEAIRDWNGEPAFIEATLALMNARNTSTAKHVDKAEHNRKRVRRGLKPLFSHHVLTIHPRQLARVRAAETSVRTAALRAHFVRGHWKVRKTGIFFWHPHARGSVATGMVAKDYKVAAE